MLIWVGRQVAHYVDSPLPVLVTDPFVLGREIGPPTLRVHQLQLGRIRWTALVPHGAFITREKRPWSNFDLITKPERVPSEGQNCQKNLGRRVCCGEKALLLSPQE